eukprot:4284603-Amphidinium_carterae.1
MIGASVDACGGVAGDGELVGGYSEWCVMSSAGSGVKCAMGEGGGVIGEWMGSDLMFGDEGAIGCDSNLVGRASASKACFAHVL